MRLDRILRRAVLMAAFLSGCTAQAVSLAGSPLPMAISATSTPFLPALDTPVPPSARPEAVSTSIPTPAPTLTATPSGRVELRAVGDIMLARAIGDQLLSEGPGVVFAGVQSSFAAADILVGNLECAITTGGSPQTKSFTFAAPPQAAQALALAGFDVLSLANNHAMDYGPQGLLDTTDYLHQAGIFSVGSGQDAAEAHTPVILERNGLRLAFLAYMDVPVEKGGFDAHAWIATASQPGIAWADPDQIKVDVSAARLQADLVIVLIHSGFEVTPALIPNVSSNQKAEARAAVDSGAALVIGSHPHVLQKIERYRDGLIAYSLGNFVMDQYAGTANASIILRVVLTRAGVESYDWVPVLIKNGLPFLTTNLQVPAIGTMVAP
jgi:poly-gamma-glutamate capsule biosynthesis protein CapA/YwtB (metallophosphatase superfamily)